MKARRATLLVLAAVILLALAAVWGAPAKPAGPTHPTDGSVDAGFARDMALHHKQAVQMASYTRDHAPTREIQVLAASIDEGQSLEVGQMLGWLDGWGLPHSSNRAAMAWMESSSGSQMPGMTMSSTGASNVEMPGMATPAELDSLVTMTGTDLEIRFLQLMIRHHEGGLPMARFAAQHAQEPYVRNAAAAMVMEQTAEIDQMRNYLEARGGTPLPSP